MQNVTVEQSLSSRQGNGLSKRSRKHGRSAGLFPPANLSRRPDNDIFLCCKQSLLMPYARFRLTGIRHKGTDDMRAVCRQRLLAVLYVMSRSAVLQNLPGALPGAQTCQPSSLSQTSTVAPTIRTVPHNGHVDSCVEDCLKLT